MARKTTTISQRNKIRISIILILLLAILAGFLDYPKAWDDSVDWVNSKLPFSIPHYANLPFKLGLDLQGGTHLVYQADVSQVPGGDQSEAIEGVRDVVIFSWPIKNGRENEIVAFIESSIQEKTLKKLLTENLEDYALPRKMKVVDRMPLLSTGKYNRNLMLRHFT